MKVRGCSCHGNGPREETNWGETGSGVLLVGPAREASTRGGEVAPHGAAYLPWQQHGAGTKGGVLFCCLSWTRAAVPRCVHLYVSQKLHHQEVSSDPLRDLSSSSPTLCVCLYELRIGLNPFPINYMTAKHFGVLAHMHALSLPLLIGWPPQPDHLDICR